jgi:FdhD protein
MNSKYKVLKYNSGKFENIEDLISIEEPLEISIKFKVKRRLGNKNFINYYENSW